MKADSRFNKRAAPEVLSNSTTVDFNQYLDKECPIRMTVYRAFIRELMRFAEEKAFASRAQTPSRP